LAAVPLRLENAATDTVIAHSGEAVLFLVAGNAAGYLHCTLIPSTLCTKLQKHEAIWFNSEDGVPRIRILAYTDE
jgi:hypothetical protein